MPLDLARHSFGDGREEEIDHKAIRRMNDERSIYVIRHGSTELNEKDEIRGWSNPPLSTLGRKEAAALAKKLADSGIEVIFHSDLGRAADTAEALARTTGAKLYAMKQLRPWDLGKFTGRSSSQVIPEITRFAENSPDRPVAGGESFNSFLARAKRGVKDALENSNGKKLALVTHHRVERAIQAGLLEKPDLKVDCAVMFQKGEKPGHAERVKIHLPTLAGSRDHSAMRGESIEGPHMDWDGKAR